MGPAKIIAVDTSVIAAIQFDEPDADDLYQVLKQADKLVISSASLLEARMVVYGKYGHAGVLRLDAFIKDGGFEVLPPTQADIDTAFAAFVLYGKGNGHPASLNFGDLFAYALARTRGLPLLFKGNDFSQTDVIDAREEHRQG